jgi:hypothetical protein
MKLHWIKTEANRMADKNDKQETFSTCLEDISCAEMMQKMRGGQKLGSLCEEMMKKAGRPQADKCSSHCAELMRSIMKDCRNTKEKTDEVDNGTSDIKDK